MDATHGVVEFFGLIAKSFRHYNLGDDMSWFNDIQSCCFDVERMRKNIKIEEGILGSYLNIKDWLDNVPSYYRDKAEQETYDIFYKHIRYKKVIGDTVGVFVIYFQLKVQLAINSGELTSRFWTEPEYKDGRPIIGLI